MTSIFFSLLMMIGSFAAAEGSYPILQGATSNHVTHFTVVAKADETLDFNIRAGDAGSHDVVAVSTDRVTYPGSDYVVYRLRAEGLKDKGPLFLEVNKNGLRVDRREFKTLDPNAETGRVAVGSCMLRHFHNPFLWNNLARPENRPDAFLLIGDAVYLDRRHLLSKEIPENGLQVWTEFVKARLTENLYFWDHLVPMFTVWDDHDAGGDGADSTFKILPEARRIYEIFFANNEISGFLEHGPGLATRFRLFNKNYVMLDGRSYRNADPHSPMWGQDQERWLLNSLKPGANFIVNGSQFFGGYLQKDSLEYNWPEYTAEWSIRLKQAAEQRGASLAFLSGDIHFSEVQDLEPAMFGYPTVEITSSNLHSAGLPGHYFFKPDNPRRREVTGTHNVVLLDFSQALDGPFTFQVWSMGWRGTRLFETVVAIPGPNGIGPLASTSSCETQLTN